MFFFRRTCSRTIPTPRHPVASLFFATLSGLMLSESALASNITIASPVNGTRVSSSIWVRAHNRWMRWPSPASFWLFHRQ